MHGENEIEITVDVDDSASKEMNNIAGVFEKLKGIGASFADKFGSSLGDATSAIGGFGQSVGQAGMQMASSEAAATVASDGLNLVAAAAIALASAMPMVIGGFLALAPALLAVGGAAGAATSMLAGAGVALGTLFIGISGVGKAWDAYSKQAAGGGGSSGAAGKQAEAAAKAIENAEYSLTQAKRSATKASEDLTKAREQERIRLMELSLQLRAGKFAEADAAKSVKEAEEKLAWTRIYGSQQAQQDAQDELDRARLTYDEKHEKLGLLQKEQAKADKDGVEGSDQVVAAKDRVRTANEQVARAAQALADAQHNAATSSVGAAGGVNQFANAMAKLSPNARAFVRELISLSERFDKIKKQVQEHLFAGLDTALENLAQKWLPKIGPMLDNMADALNVVAKGIMGALGNSDFINGITAAAKGFADVLRQDIGPAIEHVIHAFGLIAGDSVEPMKEIAGWILQIADNFDKWITKAHKSGDLKDFMHDAAHTLHQIWDIGKLAFDIVGQFIAILFPESKKESGGVLDSVERMLTKVSKWLGDPKNQQRVRDWIDAAIEFGKQMIKAAGAVIWLGGKIGGFIGGVINGLSRARHAWNDFFDGIKSGFRSAMNWVIDRWNSLNFKIGGFSVFGMDVPGVNIGVGHLNHFATGGAGSGKIVAGENGPEVIDLQAGRVWAASNSRRMAGGGRGDGGGGSDRPIVVQLMLDGKMIQQAVIEPTREFVQQRFGGSVQAAYGR
jgi:hypothetical protein